MIEERKLTRGPFNHFFGYYGINPWDSTAGYHLALQTNFHRRPPKVDDEAAVGLVDRGSGDFIRYGDTCAFNLKQGSMMHWIDAGHGEEFTYNAWSDGRLISKAVNKDTREERIISGAIAAVSVDGRQAMGLNYARMYHCRTVVGYANHIEPESLPIAPEDDGHACYSPDRRWIVCDTSPGGPNHVSELMLYNVESGVKTTIGEFASEPVFEGDVRCDLHPRWASDGKTISIDAVPDGDRQIYLLDVSEIVR